MKILQLTTISMLVFFSQFLCAYWNQIGTNSQVTPPLPTTIIAEETAETKTSEVNKYTVQKSLIDNLRTQIAYSRDETASIEMMNAALDRVRQLGTTTTQDYIERALDNPTNALEILNQGLEDLDQWYSNLPGFP